MEDEMKVAVVTGGNRGIGREICRQLAGPDARVILTARSQESGEQAAREMRTEGLDVLFQPLDVTDEAAARRLLERLADEFGRADILVNNAGIYVDRGASAKDVELDLVRQTMETNFYGPLRLCQMFIPLMKRHDYGRIVNVSSQMASLNDMGSGALAYRVSKVALNALTRVLAKDVSGSNILVNSVDPGWVSTDMGGASAPRSVAEGADTAVWLATLPDSGPNAGFFRDRQQRQW
jgi:NAD(P)-dependent dehydrogenase (short-subunit alcohol dehydrogenase family)